MFKKLIILLVLFTLIATGCTDKDSTTISTSDGDGDVDISVNVPEGSENEWCPIGMTWDVANPQTGETLSMEVVATETVDGVEMCKAVLEIDSDDEIAKMVYLFSEDGETFEWTYYDADGNILSQMSMKNGEMTMTDEEGNVVNLGGMT